MFAAAGRSGRVVLAQDDMEQLRWTVEHVSDAHDALQIMEVKLHTGLQEHQIDSCNSRLLQGVAKDVGRNGQFEPLAARRVAGGVCAPPSGTSPSV